MNSNLVSVIIPTRNRPAYLRQAVDSVYAQQYPQFEILVVDDGSTDATAEALKGYDERLRYLRQEHRGVAAARNHGIAHARGSLVAFLDDDDLFLPEKLEQNVAYMAQHPEVVWLCSGFQLVDAAGVPLPRTAIIPAPEITLHDIALFAFIHTSSVVIRRHVIEAAGGFPEGVRVSEDYHTWARVLMRGKGASLQQPLTHFRQHAQNTKLPFWRLLRENSRIIEMILATQAPGLLPRDAYYQNLHRIIHDSLVYKRKRGALLAFQLWQAIR